MAGVGDIEGGEAAGHPVQQDVEQGMVPRDVFPGRLLGVLGVPQPVVHGERTVRVPAEQGHAAPDADHDQRDTGQNPEDVSRPFFAHPCIIGIWRLLSPCPWPVV